MLVESSKQAFLNTWPGGFSEQWAVYGPSRNISEEEFASICLTPFFNRDHVAMEVGCGTGLWVNKYLAPNFKQVVALDYLKSIVTPYSNVIYTEVPDRNYDCYSVSDNSIDFVWEFGVFCHLVHESIQKYLHSIYRVLKPGGKGVIYFANSERLEWGPTQSNTADSVACVECTLNQALSMLAKAGFVNIKDMIPWLKDTMAYVEKPKHE